MHNYELILFLMLFPLIITYFIIIFIIDFILKYFESLKIKNTFIIILLSFLLFLSYKLYILHPWQLEDKFDKMLSKIGL